MSWINFRHLTKLDPDREISEEKLRAILNSGTDGVMISGTQNIRPENISELAERISKLNSTGIPLILEPSRVIPIDFSCWDYVFIPVVLNTQDPEFLIGAHLKWLDLQPEVDSEKLVSEAYIVLNPNSAVFRYVKAYLPSTSQVISLARYADCIARFPVVYLEFSGRYGDPELVSQVKLALKRSRLFYGGGIDSRSKALEMARYADTIVVGNVVYNSGLEDYLSTIP